MSPFRKQYKEGNMEMKKKPQTQTGSRGEFTIIDVWMKSCGENRLQKKKEGPQQS